MSTEVIFYCYFFKIISTRNVSRCSAGNCSENWCCDGETPARQHYVLASFPLTWRIKVSQSAWNAPFLLMILYDRYMLFNIYSLASSDVKKAAYQPSWCIGLLTAQQAYNSFLQKYDPDKGGKKVMLSCIEIYPDISVKLLQCLVLVVLVSFCEKKNNFIYIYIYTHKSMGWIITPL